MRGLYGPAQDLPLVSRQAIHCWNWCGGWYPERWPIYMALHDEVQDWASLPELMLAIRDAQETKNERRSTAAAPGLHRR